MVCKMPNTFVIIKGQPKALQTERFQMGNNGVFPRLAQ